MKVVKLTVLPLFLQLKNIFFKKKTACYAQVEAQPLTKQKTQNVRHYALKGQHLVQKDWCNGSAPNINLKCIEFFTRGLPEKLKDFALKWWVKHTATVIEPSIPCHKLVKQVDAEDITNKTCTLELTHEINHKRSKLESENLSAETCYPNPQIMFTQATNPNSKSKPQFRKNCNYCHKSIHFVSNCFRK